jgi:hypothetical protein
MILERYIVFLKPSPYFVMSSLPQNNCRRKGQLTKQIGISSFILILQVHISKSCVFILS